MRVRLLRCVQNAASEPTFRFPIPQLMHPSLSLLCFPALSFLSVPLWPFVGSFVGWLAGWFAQETSKSKAQEIEALLKHGAYAIFAEDSTAGAGGAAAAPQALISDEEIDRILARGDSAAADAQLQRDDADGCVRAYECMRSLAGGRGAG